MPASEGKRDSGPLLIAGAMFGVITTLAMLLALVQSVDARYVTRREFDATLSAINGRLERIEHAVQPDSGSR